MKIVTNPDGSQSLEMSETEGRALFEQLRARFETMADKRARILKKKRK